MGIWKKGIFGGNAMRDAELEFRRQLTGERENCWHWIRGSGL